MMNRDTKAHELGGFDKRTAERYIREGKIDPKEYEAYLKRLPDDGDNAGYIEVFEEPPPEEPTPQAENGKLTFT